MNAIDNNFQDLAGAVEAAGGIKAVTMEALREAYKAGRLGTHVRSGIHDKLEEHGLGHLPAELPSYQHEEVRLFSLGRPIGKIVKAVKAPSEAGDQLLREVANADARDILQKVRELICE